MKTSLVLLLAFSGLGQLPTQASSPQTSPSAEAQCLLGDDSLLQAAAPGFPAFPDNFESSFPQDAYCGGTIEKAKRGGCLTDQIKIQRLYDIFAWKNFLALQWPTTSTGQIQPLFTSQGAPRWNRWKQAQEIFRPGGAPPLPWGTPRSKLPEFHLGLKNADPFAHFLLAKRKDSSLVWDQNGNHLYFEVLLNESSFNYIQKSQLYHIEGQLCFSKTHPVGGVQFPFGPEYPDSGPVLVKFGWKRLAGNDIRSRFFTLQAYLPDERNGWQQAEVGLVAVHIARRTRSAPQWVWLTFEHVDSLQVDGMEVLARAQKGETLRPLFFNPDCSTCPVNVATPAGEKQPTQVARLIPISAATENLNRQIQALLKNKGSVWQYYKLVGTQYPTSPGKDPTGPGQGIESITNHSGGQPFPSFLTNALLETFFQRGNRTVTHLNPEGNEELVFSTGSCMGCHYDAKLATEKQANGQVARTAGKADFTYVFEDAHNVAGPYQCSGAVVSESPVMWLAGADASDCK